MKKLIGRRTLVLLVFALLSLAGAFTASADSPPTSPVTSTVTASSIEPEDYCWWCENHPWDGPESGRAMFAAFWSPVPYNFGESTTQVKFSSRYERPEELDPDQMVIEYRNSHNGELVQKIGAPTLTLGDVDLVLFRKDTEQGVTAQFFWKSDYHSPEMGVTVVDNGVEPDSIVIWVREPKDYPSYSVESCAGNSLTRVTFPTVHIYPEDGAISLNAHEVLSDATWARMRIYNMVSHELVGEIIANIRPPHVIDIDVDGQLGYGNTKMVFTGTNLCGIRSGTKFQIRSEIHYLDCVSCAQNPEGYDVLKVMEPLPYFVTVPDYQSSDAAIWALSNGQSSNVNVMPYANGGQTFVPFVVQPDLQGPGWRQ